MTISKVLAHREAPIPSLLDERPDVPRKLDAVVGELDEEGKVEITWQGEKGKLSISVDPGKHRLKIQKDGFQLFARDFEIESGGTTTIRARLESLAKRGSQSGQVEQAQSWYAKAAALKGPDHSTYRTVVPSGTGGFSWAMTMMAQPRRLAR